MRFAICLPALALLTACAVVPQPAWTFDPTQPEAKAVMPTADMAALGDRTNQLQLERNDIRARISGERDARRRAVLYEHLHRVGLELARVERRLGSVAAAR